MEEEEIRVTGDNYILLYKSIGNNTIQRLSLKGTKFATEIYTCNQLLEGLCNMCNSHMTYVPNCNPFKICPVGTHKILEF